MADLDKQGNKAIVENEAAERPKRKQEELEETASKRKVDDFDVDGVINVASSDEDDDDENESDDDKVGELMSRPQSKEDVLERKPTLDPEFMKRLTVPDEKDDDHSHKLFETNQAPVASQYSRTSGIASRKTGFESWLRNKTPAKQLYGDGTSENNILLAFKNLSLNVIDRHACCSRSSRMLFQNCNRDCLDRGAEDDITGRQVLRGISGVMVAGKTTLVIGPPGCNSTALLRALSGRLNVHEKVYHDLCVSQDGPIDLKEWYMRRKSAFVSSDDNQSHIPSLTVRETLEIAARLTMGGAEDNVSEEDLKELVDRVVESLGLSDQANTIIGDERLRGVTTSQKRRVTLGEMLFSRHTKLLFLDDTCNGLDSSKSQQIIRIIRSACRVLGFSAMAALLQPNDMMFDAFDNVIVLSSKGEMVFNGPTSEAVPYFEILLERSAGDNEEVNDWTRPGGMAAAEYILMAVTMLEERARSKPELSSLSAKFLVSSDGSKLFEELSKVETHISLKGTKEKDSGLYTASVWAQFRVLARRKLLVNARNPMILQRAIVAIAFGIIIATLFSSLNQDLLGGFSRSGFFFLCSSVVFMISTVIAIPEYHSLQRVFHKQHGSAFYTPWVYYLTNLLCDLPLALVEALLVSLITYWWVDLRSNDAGGFFYFFAVLLALEFVGQAVARVFAALCPTVILAQLAATGYIFLCALFSGFMPRYQDTPKWWQWINWITPLSYAQEGLVLNNYVAGGRATTSFPVLVVHQQGSTERLGVITGEEIATTIGQPRIAFDDATDGLDSAGKVMAFDFGMLLIFSFVLNLLGLGVLLLSQRWFEPWARNPMWTTRTKATIREADEVLKLVKAQFVSLKREEEKTSQQKESNADDDPAMMDTDKTNVESALLSSPSDKNNEDSQESFTLAIIDISYYALDSQSKVTGLQSEAKSDQMSLFKRWFGWKNSFTDVIRVDDRNNGENLAWSFQRFYSWILYRLNLFGKQKPTPGPSKFAVYESDALPAEERIHVLVHRPRTDSKRGRAWSNKLPMDEEDPELRDFPKSGEVQLLDSVTGYFRTSETTIVFGEPGCGKTTLLEVLAGRRINGRTTGDMYLNGNKVTGVDLQRFIGYVEQVDLHNPVLTVYETLMFAAACRLSHDTSDEERRKLVERVMDVLGIAEFRDIVVGPDDSLAGLAKHARKRLTIAVELMAQPRILFLDEPTDGLDSLGAEIVAQAIVDASKMFNIAVIVAISQPSRAVFGRFDRLLYLKQGQVVYHGAISSFKPFDTEGASSSPSSVIVKSANVADKRDWRVVNVVQRQPSGLQSIPEGNIPSVEIPEMLPAPTIGDTVLAYFAGLGAPPLKQGFNPADHLLLAVESLEDNGVNVVDLFNDSTEMKAVWVDISASTKTPSALPPAKCPAPYLRQLGALMWRSLLTQWRDPRFAFFRFIWYTLSAMFIGTTFIRLGCSLEDAIYRIAAVFFVVCASVIQMQVIIMPHLKERAVVYRELASGMYPSWLGWLARIIVDIPYHFAMAVIFYAIFYYAVEFSTASQRTGYFVLMLFFAFWMLNSFGQAVSMLAPNMEIAEGLGGLVLLLSIFLMGFAIPSKLMPKGWRWTLWINMLAYIIQGLSVNELKDQWFQINLGNEDVLPCGPMWVIGSSTPFGFVGRTPQATPETRYWGNLRGSLEIYSSHEYSGQLVNPNLELNKCKDAFAEIQASERALTTCLNAPHCAHSSSLDDCLVHSCTSDTMRYLISIQNGAYCLPEEVRVRLQGPLDCAIRSDLNTDAPLNCLARSRNSRDFSKQYGDVVMYLLEGYSNSPELTSWLVYLIAFQVVYVPANLVLSLFDWADRTKDNTGYTADTNWWYCIFAVAMFIVGWETIKLFGRRFVYWSRRY